ncbi:MAG: N-acetylmuramoyl-L-alanine amidase, partial [Ignavibacteria bacterium]|nr:N-acetylmuramoyl-L-alanine amidase [Ignavibacteria bacterium]
TKTTQLENRGILEEEFIVNWTASMPSVLVECGYLSNKKDEAYLRSKDGQYDIARSIYKAIRYYKMDYEWENSF